MKRKFHPRLSATIYFSLKIKDHRTHFKESQKSYGKPLYEEISSEIEIYNRLGTGPTTHKSLVLPIIDIEPVLRKYLAKYQLSINIGISSILFIIPEFLCKSSRTSRYFN